MQSTLLQKRSVVIGVLSLNRHAKQREFRDRRAGDIIGTILHQLLNDKNIVTRFNMTKTNFLSNVGLEEI